MKIASLLKDTLKAATLGAIAGVALSFALPPLARAVGVPVDEAVGQMAKPVWMATFVATFNVALTLVHPVVDYFFGDKAHAQETPAHETAPSPSAALCAEPPAKGFASEKTQLYAERILAEYASREAQAPQP